MWNPYVLMRSRVRERLVPRGSGRVDESKVPRDFDIGRPELPHGEFELNEAPRHQVVREPDAPAQGGPAHEERWSGRLEHHIEPERGLQKVALATRG